MKITKADHSTSAFSLLIIIVVAAIFQSCSGQEAQSKYLRWVGDIEPNPAINDSGFNVCYREENVRQYFHLGRGPQYDGEMFQIRETFFDSFTPVDVNESGLIRLRFMVNCRGEAGRFRLISADENYGPREFDRRITDQVLSIAKGMDGWKPLPDPDGALDYYLYLIFKIENGAIIEILP